jgi:hypothetical protein
MNQKARCIAIEVGQSDLTIGKVYDVIDIDPEGDVWIIGDCGDRFFMYPSECEVFYA